VGRVQVRVDPVPSTDWIGQVTATLPITTVPDVFKFDPTKVKVVELAEEEVMVGVEAIV
jgi:hypothetical protein